MKFIKLGDFESIKILFERTKRVFLGKLLNNTSQNNTLHRRHEK